VGEERRAGRPTAHHPSWTVALILMEIRGRLPVVPLPDSRRFV
jgi:hypothetical protein